MSTVELIDRATGAMRDHWKETYSEGKGEAAKTRKFRLRREYETNAFIDSHSDHEIFDHMEVPLKFRLPLTEHLPVGVEEWLMDLPWAFNPSYERLRENPAACGKSLVLHGPPGSGKSTLAAGLLLSLVRAKIPMTVPALRNDWHGAAMGLWVGWQDFSEDLRRAVRSESKSLDVDVAKTRMMADGPYLYRGDWLVIDDLSRERPSEFNHNELSRVLRYRTENGLPTIITTNAVPDDWEKQYNKVMAGFLLRSCVAADMRWGWDPRAGE